MRLARLAKTTWRRPSALAVVVASSGRGGGLAVIHQADLKLSSVPLPDLTSMECLGYRCKPSYYMTLLLINRHPKLHSSFLPEIHDLLTSLCTISTNIVIIGDVNTPGATPLIWQLRNSALISSPEVHDLGVSHHNVSMVN